MVNVNERDEPNTRSTGIIGFIIPVTLRHETTTVNLNDWANGGVALGFLSPPKKPSSTFAHRIAVRSLRCISPGCDCGQEFGTVKHTKLANFPFSAVPVFAADVIAQINLIMCSHAVLDLREPAIVCSCPSPVAPCRGWNPIMKCSHYNCIPTESVRVLE